MTRPIIESTRSPADHGAPSVASSVMTLLVFFTIAMIPPLVVTYPAAAAVLFAGAIVAAGVAISLAGLVRRHRGSLRRIDVPGIGTVEYRVRRS